MLTFMKNWNPKNIESTLHSAAIELTHHPKKHFDAFYKWARNHGFVIENKLEVWTWQRAFKARHGDIVLFGSNRVFPADVPGEIHYFSRTQHNPKSFRYLSVSATKILASRTKGDITQLNSTANPTVTRTEKFTEFIGDGPQRTSVAAQVVSKLPLSGPVQSYPGIADRAFLLTEDTWAASTGAFTPLQQYFFPVSLINQPEIKKCLLGVKFVSWDSICVWVTVRQPAFTAGSLAMSVGPSDVVTSSLQSNVRNSLIYVDADMSEENCVDVPWPSRFPAYGIGDIPASDPSPASPVVDFSRMMLFVLHPLVSALPGTTAVAHYQVWMKFKGLKTYGTLPTQPAPTMYTQSGRTVRVSASQLRKFMRNDFSDDEEAEQAEHSDELVHTTRPTPPVLTVSTTAPPLTGPVSGVATAVEKTAHVVAAAASTLGMSKPLVESKIERINYGFTTDRGDGQFNGFRAAQRTHQTLDTWEIGTIGKDETTFDVIQQIPTLVFSNSISAGAPLYHNVSPNLFDVFCTPNPITSTWTGVPAWSAVPTICTSFWDGSVNYLLRFTAPTGTVATITIEYEPDINLYTRTPTIWTASVFRKVIQVDEHAVVSFNFPYTRMDRWLNNTMGPFVADPTQDFTDACLGLLTITLKSISAIAPVAVTSVYLDVFMAAGSDMKRAIYTPKNVNGVLSDSGKKLIHHSKKSEEEEPEPFDMFEQFNPFAEFSKTNFKPFSCELETIVVGNRQYGAELVDSFLDILKRPAFVAKGTVGMTVSNTTPMIFTPTPISTLAAGTFFSYPGEVSGQIPRNTKLASLYQYILAMYARGRTSFRYQIVTPVNAIATVSPFNGYRTIDDWDSPGAFALFDVGRTNKVDIEIPFFSYSLYSTPNTVQWCGEAGVTLTYDVDASWTQATRFYFSFGDDLQLTNLITPGSLTTNKPTPM